MDTYKQKFTALQNEIFRLLCIKAGTSLNQREIARLFNVSPTAVAKSLKLMMEKRFIIMEKQKLMNLVLIKLNQDNQKIMQLKRVENLSLIYEYNLSDFLKEELPGATIIVFGSYSRGDDTITSDIDIAIIGRKEKEIDLTKFEKLFERKIILNFYPSMKDIHKNLKENLCNGIVLEGGIEL